MTMRKLLFAVSMICLGYWVAVHQMSLQIWWRDLSASFDRRLDHGAVNGANHEPATESHPPPSHDIAKPAERPPLPPLEEGVYYTRHRISQVTPTGVFSIGPLVRVKKVGEQQGRFIVTDGRQTVVTTLSSLMNDPDEVAIIPWQTDVTR